MADAEASQIDLAHEGDFSLGQLLVRPSLRAVLNDGAEQLLEPRVMQVLVALARRAGEVVSRDDLVELCWGGRAVGEDAIHRPISRVRKLGEETGAFSIETIPRIGYRLKAAGPVSIPQPQVSAAAEPQAPAKPVSKRTIIAAALGLLALAIAGWGIASFAGRPRLEPSIAVLPFENLSGDPAKDYLARGVSMKIIDTLAQLKGIEVISRNSSFSFPFNAIPTEVGTKLNVAHVLSGTVLDQDGRLTITATLINARTGKTIRSEKYVADTAETRIGGAQAYIAEKIAGAMSIAFNVEAGQRLDGGGTDSLEAYDLYLRGLYVWWIESNSPAAIDYYTKATDIDPEYAEPWAGLAIAIASTGFSFANPADARARQNIAYEHAQRALKLGPTLNIVQSYYGAVTTTQLKWIEGEEAFQKALAISRSEQALLNWLFLLQRTGRVAEVARVMTEIERIDPVRGLNALALHAYASQGRFDEMKADVTRRGWFTSTELVPLYNMLSYHINVGSPRADIRAALEGISRRPEQAPAELASRMLAVLDNPEKARAVLREAYADERLAHFTRWEMVPYLAAWLEDDELVLRLWRDELPTNMLRTLYMWDPAFARARKLPEFKVLMRELHLPEYWRAKGWADKCQAVGPDDFECT